MFSVDISLLSSLYSRKLVNPLSYTWNVCENILSCLLCQQLQALGYSLLSESAEAQSTTVWFSIEEMWSLALGPFRCNASKIDTIIYPSFLWKTLLVIILHHRKNNSLLSYRETWQAISKDRTVANRGKLLDIPQTSGHSFAGRWTLQPSTWVVALHWSNPEVGSWCRFLPLYRVCVDFIFM